MRTSNCCSQIRFCALNYDLQIRRFCALNCDLQIRFCALNCDLQIRFCALNCDLQIRFCALNCDLQIRFCTLNCDLQIRCTILSSIKILNAVFFLSFALQTSNCCLQIRFCALNCDVQIRCSKSRSLVSCIQSLTWATVGLVTEFSVGKRERSKWRMQKSIPSRYSHRTEVLTSNYCDSGTKQTKCKPKRDV